MSEPNSRYLVASVVVGNVLMFGTGANVAWSSPVLTTLVKPGDDNPLHEPLTTSEFSWIGSLVLLGSIFGPPLVSLSSAKLGRKWTMVWLAIPLLISSLTLAFAEHILWYYFARFVGGIAVGGSVAVVPNYLAEITDKCRRGTTGATMKVFSVMGIFYGYIVGPYVSVMWFSLAIAVPPVIFLAIFPFFMPESPYSLISHGKEEEARKVLTKLRGGTLDLEELQEIEDVVKANANGTFNDLFRNELAIKGLTIVSVLLILQQLSGVNIVIGYAQTILNEAQSSLSSEKSAMLMGGMQVIGAIIAPMFVDRFGRKCFLVGSALGMFVAEMLLGVYFYFEDLREEAWLPTFCLVLYIFSYSVGIGPLPWLLMAELLPTIIKARASAIASMICWIVAFGITYSFPMVSEGIGMYWSFWFFAGVDLFTIAFTIICVPETKGKSPKELEMILKKKEKSQLP